MIEVPTNWQQMRYCIVAALDKLGGDGRPEVDREGIYTSTLQFTVESIFEGQGGSYTDWSMEAHIGKAFYRAMDSLRDDGTIVSGSDDGYRLAWWDA